MMSYKYRHSATANCNPQLFVKVVTVAEALGCCFAAFYLFLTLLNNHMPVSYFHSTLSMLLGP